MTAQDWKDLAKMIRESTVIETHHDKVTGGRIDANALERLILERAASASVTSATPTETEC